MAISRRRASINCEAAVLGCGSVMIAKLAKAYRGSMIEMSRNAAHGALFPTSLQATVITKRHRSILARHPKRTSAGWIDAVEGRRHLPLTIDTTGEGSWLVPN